MIIHICCVFSDRHELGKKIKETHGSDIVIFDLQMLLEKFKTDTVKITREKYQKYLEELFNKYHQKEKHIILLGMNRDVVDERKMYNVKADCKLFVQVRQTDTKGVFVQKYENIVTETFFNPKFWDLNCTDENYKDKLHELWLKNPKEVMEKINKNLRKLSPISIKQHMNNVRGEYKRHGYKVVDIKNVLTEVNQILKKKDEVLLSF